MITRFSCFSFPSFVKGMGSFLRGFFLCLSFLMGTSTLSSDSPSPSPPLLTLTSQQRVCHPGSPFWVAFRLSLSPGMHAYWMNPGDAGLPLTIDWSLPDGFSVEPLVYPTPRLFTHNQQMTIGYGGKEATEVVYLVKVTPFSTLRPGAYTLKASASWLTCSGDTCLPGFASLDLPVECRLVQEFKAEEKEKEHSKTLDLTAPWHEWLQNSPAPLTGMARWEEISSRDSSSASSSAPSPGEPPLTLFIAAPFPWASELASGVSLASCLFVCEEPGKIPYTDQTFSLTRQIVSGASEEGLEIRIPLSSPTDLLSPQGSTEVFAPAPLLKGLVFLTFSNGQRRTYQGIFSLQKMGNSLHPALATSSPSVPVSPPQDNLPQEKALDSSLETSLWQSLFFALLGGIFLNGMPCVFPILSIKALSIAKKKKSGQDHIRLQGLCYTAGVTVSFLSLGFLLMGLKKAGMSLGWGFQMQSPAFVLILVDLLFLMALSLSGVFYFPLLFGKTTSGVSENSLRGTFLLGILAVLVATPCTAPFMGVAIGYALTQEGWAPLLIFTFLSLGFSFPYLALCYFPRLLSFFPKPGPWMETFKEFLAFPLYATVVWLLWVLVHQQGPNGLLVGGMSLVFIGLCVWIWHKSRGPKSLMFPVMFFTVLSPLAWLQSPDSNDPNGGHSFSKKQTITESSATDSVKNPLTKTSFSLTALDTYRQKGLAVFVNVTASWCITCQYNELVFKSQSVKDLFEKEEIQYLEADWTKYNKEITDFLKQFGRQGVPLYIYYPPRGAPPVVLPQFLSEKTLREAIGSQASSPIGSDSLNP